MDNVEEFINKSGMDSIEKIVLNLSKFVCHIGQEPNIFGTHSRRKGVDRKIAKKAYFIRRIEDISVDDYLNFFINGTGIAKDLISEDGRAAGGCKHMAEIAARLASKLLDKDVYVLGRVLPKYVRGRNTKINHEHYFNAFIESEKIKYFDSAVYNKFYDIDSNSWINYDCTKFNVVDLNFDKDINWKHYLQTGTNQQGAKIREIKLFDDGFRQIINDNFAQNKLNNGYFYSKVEGPENVSFTYGVDQGKIIKIYDGGVRR